MGAGVPAPLLVPLVFPLPSFSMRPLPKKLPPESSLVNPGGDLGPTILLPSLSNLGGSGSEVLDLLCVVDARVLCAERRAMAALGSYHVPMLECGEVRAVGCGDVDTGCGGYLRHSGASANPQ
jgi:hypothetical protein